MAIAVAPSVGRATPESLVFIDDRATPVRFPDGDTLTFVSGTGASRSARLIGVNTLETYGPVHQWPGAPRTDLERLAKLATAHARRGIWHCSLLAGANDAYGRALADCPDLARSLLRFGLGHAYSIGRPAAPAHLRSQRQAIAEGRGMWAFGAPALLLTSVHSRSEHPRHPAYDRLVSTSDGAALPWPHATRYRTCAAVCVASRSLTATARAELLRTLRTDVGVANIVSPFTDAELARLLDEVATTGRVPHVVEPDGWERLRMTLDGIRREPERFATVPAAGACLTYVPLEQRYRHRPPCLTARGRR